MAGAPMPYRRTMESTLSEFGQSLTDYRSGDPFDLAADTLGLAVGSLIVLVKDVWKQSKNK